MMDSQRLGRVISEKMSKNNENHASAETIFLSIVVFILDKRIYEKQYN